MTDTPTQPAKIGRMTKWALGIAGAAALAFWQGVGTRAVDLVFGSSDPVEAGPGTSSPNAPAKPAEQSVPSTDKAGALDVPKYLKEQIDLPLTASEREASQDLACAAAVGTITDQAKRQCDKIAIENGGSSSEIVEKAITCSSCAPVGGQWRCIAKSEVACKIYSGGN